MSIASLVQRKGSTVTLYAPTATTNPDGSAGKSAWAVLETDAKVVIQPITDELAQRVYGGKGVIRDRGFYTGVSALAPGHGLVVTAGHRTATRFRIEEVLDYQSSTRNAHRELALVETTEVIP